MNTNSNDDKQKQEQEKDEPIIDIEDVENLSIEELEKLIEELENSESEHRKPKVVRIGSPLKMFDNVILELLYKVLISFILIFSINTLFNVIATNIVNFLVYFLIYVIIDISLNMYIRKRLFFLTLYTFGLIHFFITVLAFIVSGIICIQFLEITFKPIITCIMLIIIYSIIKRFVLNYLLKIKGKINHKKRGASK